MYLEIDIDDINKDACFGPFPYLQKLEKSKLERTLVRLLWSDIEYFVVVLFFGEYEKKFNILCGNHLRMGIFTVFFPSFLSYKLKLFEVWCVSVSCYGEKLQDRCQWGRRTTSTGSVCWALLSGGGELASLLSLTMWMCISYPLDMLHARSED